MLAEVKAQMAGTVFEVKVKQGDSVEVGQMVVILESMKMEIPVEAEEAGVVVEIRVAEGDFVNEEDILVVIG